MVNSQISRLTNLFGANFDRPRELTDVTFEDLDFPRITVGPGAPPGAGVKLSRCVFANCVVGGEFRIAPGCELRDVVFDSVSSPDSLLIATQTVLSNVVVKGAPKCGGLWIKPAEIMDPVRMHSTSSWAEALNDGVELMLDFSEYRSDDVEVIGLPLSKLRWNASIHVPVDLAWTELPAWKLVRSGLGPFWSLRLKRLRSFKVNVGVFSLPAVGDKEYARTIDELTQLCECGIINKWMTC